MQSPSLLLVPAGIITKRQSCYLLPFIPQAFDVFNAVCTEECDEVLLLPFHIWGKRDVASHSQEVLEHLMPLEISCSGALKYPGKNTYAWGTCPDFLILRAACWHLVESPRREKGMPLQAGGCCQPGRPAESGSGARVSTGTAGLGGAGTAGQGCPAEGKLQAEHQHTQSQRTKAGGHVLEQPFSMAGRFSGSPRDYSCFTARGSILRILWLLRKNPSSAPHFSMAFNKLFLIFL